MNTPVPPPPPPEGSGTPPPPPGGSGTPPPPPPPHTQPGPPPPGQPQPASPPGYAPAPGQPQPGSPPGYGPASGQPQPGYGPAPGFEQKPPRPDAKVGASLIVAGAVLIIIGVFLPWLDNGGETRNGTDVFITSDLTVVESPGTLMIIIAVIVGGLGIALFFAGRVLAVAIVAIVMSAIAVLMGLAMIGIMNDVAFGGDTGIGAILQPIAPLASLAGSIVVTAKRRR